MTGAPGGFVRPDIALDQLARSIHSDPRHAIYFVNTLRWALQAFWGGTGVTGWGKWGP